MCTVLCSSNDGQGGWSKRGISAHPNLVGNLQLLLNSLQLGIPRHPFSLQKSFHDVKGIVYAENLFLSDLFLSVRNKATDDNSTFRGILVISLEVRLLRDVIACR